MGDEKAKEVASLDEAVERYVSLLEQIPPVLGSVQDDASAEAAIQKLDAIVSEMNETIEAGQKLGEPTPELKAKMESRVDGFAEQMGVEMMRIAQDEKLQHHMKGISETMQKMKRPGSPAGQAPA